MMTVDVEYKKFVEKLRVIYDERESANISDWVFESIAKVNRLERITNRQLAISNSTYKQLNNALEQLLLHKPVQYILKEAWFYKMKLIVNEHVLIPRPETEELVEWIVEEIRDNKSGIRNTDVSTLSTHHSPLTVLDIGTGSGCMAIALKKEFPETVIFAIDVSKEALEVAKQNAADQNVKIVFINLDFLHEDQWALLNSIDIIISNPPYIPEIEKIKLAKNVVEHEPHLALFVPDNDPFIFYKKIASFAGEYLKKEGKVFIEVHEDYAKEVKQIFMDKNFTTEIKKDIYGRERMIQSYK